MLPEWVRPTWDEARIILALTAGIAMLYAVLGTVVLLS